MKEIFYLGSGFAATVLFFTVPHVVDNLKGYWSWWNNSKNACHFILYRKYFETIGKPISEKMRGAGLKWVCLFFFRMAPFHSVGFLIAIGLDFCVWLAGGLQLQFAWRTLGVLFLSLSPILYGELTKAPQLGRSYFPGFPGILLFIVYSVFHFERILTSLGQILFWKLVTIFVFLSVLWSAWVFFSDVWPSRMTASRLGKKIKQLGIKKIYTYDTLFNTAFVDVLSGHVKKDCEIQYIQSLSEVKGGGYVAVPGISAKASHLECYPEAIANKDFNKDPFLVELIDSKRIMKAAVASFKTFGTSRIWVQESEMPTYRDLILRDISEKDRWRGRAWLLDAKKLCGERNDVQ